MPRKRAANQTVLELMERNGASGATTETETKDGRKRWRRIKPAEATTLALTVVPLVASGETNVAIARQFTPLAGIEPKIFGHCFHRFTCSFNILSDRQILT